MSESSAKNIKDYEDVTVYGLDPETEERLIAEQNRLVQSGEMGWRSLAEASMIQLVVELMRASVDREIKAARPLSSGDLSLITDYVRAHISQSTDRP